MQLSIESASKQPYQGSAIYTGKVIHNRFTPKKHRFDSSLFMLALDVAEVEKSQESQGVFGFSWYHPLRFVQKDYIKSEPKLLSQRIKDKVISLGGHADIERTLMLVQVRCFGLYFSPVNFYFCYDNADNCTQMLAEVSNTPWNERHYYLVDLKEKNTDLVTKKVFQVSPFMDINMNYIWHINAPEKETDKLLVKIQNQQKNKLSDEYEKVFEAGLVLRKKAFNKKNLFKSWVKIPVMTGKIVISIYWHALRLFLKKVPFIGYQKIS
ncbi:DUF1365 domain-containing protein [Psychromonas aquatilis]|uniref:DUF1365 domain-containing protein n=1 Tax=Psychromonas aquatilis TaxID=2005072 RepID=A0ABU9GRD0_9GAMM